MKLMPDLQRLSKRFTSGRATLEDVVRAYQAVSRLPIIVDILMHIGRKKRGDEFEVEDEHVATLLDEAYIGQLGVSAPSSRVSKRRLTCA